MKLHHTRIAPAPGGDIALCSKLGFPHPYIGEEQSTGVSPMYGKKAVYLRHWASQILFPTNSSIFISLIYFSIVNTEIFNMFSYIFYS